jgi:hypothetical protein
MVKKRPVGWNLALDMATFSFISIEPYAHPVTGGGVAARPKE